MNHFCTLPYPILKFDGDSSSSSNGRGARNVSLKSDQITSTSTLTLSLYHLNYKWEASMLQKYLEINQGMDGCILLQHPSLYTSWYNLYYKALSCHIMSSSSSVGSRINVPMSKKIFVYSYILAYWHKCSTSQWAEWNFKKLVLI